MDKDEVVNKNDKGQLHGIQIGYYESGKIGYKHNYINGHKHGEQLWYYETGQIMYKHNYINGIKHGEQIGYYSNGRISYEHYINGEYVSQEEWIAYERMSKLTIIKDL
jgi:antitoxin component YwqK of YwqJK toxin-antitoxin module